MTATALARNLSRVLDQLARGGDEIVIERNGRPLGRLVPGPARQTALEALGDLHRTLSGKEAAQWEKEARKGPWSQTIRNPWRSS